MCVLYTHTARREPMQYGEEYNNMDKEEMIQAVSDTLRKMYYEDVEFFYGFLNQYASRKGIRA